MKKHHEIDAHDSEEIWYTETHLLLASRDSRHNDQTKYLYTVVLPANQVLTYRVRVGEVSVTNLDYKAAVQLFNSL